MNEEEIKEYLKRTDKLLDKLSGEDKDTLEWLIFGYNQCAKMLYEKENIIKEVREYKNQLLFDLNRQYITFEKWEEILNPIDEILDKVEE